MAKLLGRLSLVVSIVFLSGDSYGQAVAEAPVEPETSVCLQPVARADQWWQDRHNHKLAVKAAMQEAGEPIELVFIGDSITHGWENAGKAVWAERFAPYGALNLGFSADRTEHVLWRFGLGEAGQENSEIRSLHPKLYVVMIGTNNTGHRINAPAEETAQGITAIVDQLQAVSPASNVLLLAVFPRDANPDSRARLKNDEVNRMIEPLGDRERVEFLDISDAFLDDDGMLPKSVMPDMLHPGEEGYRLWADAIALSLARYLD